MQLYDPYAMFYVYQMIFWWIVGLAFAIGVAGLILFPLAEFINDYLKERRRRARQ